MVENLTTKPNIKLDATSTTADICKIIYQCHNDEEMEKYVSIIKHQGRSLYGINFNIRFDRDIISDDIRKRI